MDDDNQNQFDDNNQIEWSEHTSPDGRRFYYNLKVLNIMIQTNESQWEKPDDLKTDEEKKCEWTVIIFK